MMRVTHPEGRCLFGLSRQDITPPVGIYHRMWGAASHDRSAGVHRPLTGSALVFASLDGAGGDADVQVLIALDHCLLGVAEVESLVQAAAQASGIAPEAILVTFSHTHAAGLLNLDRAAFPGGELIADYLQQLKEKVAEMVAAAYAGLVEVTCTYATGSCHLAAHRDYFDNATQQWVCGYNPAGKADDCVTLVRILDASGVVLATCVNYACHPTTLAWDNRLISPDYPGAMREQVEHATGAPCVFLQGASGDLGPVEGFVGDTATADRNGRQLAYAALAALEGLRPPGTFYEYAGPVVSGAAIGTWRLTSIDNARRKQLAKWAVDRSALPLPYRDDLPQIEDVQAERALLLAKEDAARQSGDAHLASELRALSERQTRMLSRLRSLPPGKEYPFDVCVWRIGDGIWVAVQGEPYQQLQLELRQRFPKHPIVVCALANGWGPSYLPPRELYHKGIYQESIASLAPGCLESLIEALTVRIGQLLK